MTRESLTIDELERWTLFGAQWRVVHVSDDRAVLDLSTCNGELVECRESDDPLLIGYLHTADSDTETEANTRRNR